MNDITELTNKQKLAIPILLANPSIEGGCKEADISKVTYYKWLNEEPFRNEIKKQQNIIVGSSIARLQASFSLAVEEMASLLKSNNENIRLKASEKIIDVNLNFAVMNALEERIAHLEEIGQ
jgi:hypothetical protein